MPLPATLVTLDVGRVTGWAWGAFEDSKPTCGSWELPQHDRIDPIGARCVALSRKLGAAFAAWHPIAVVLAERFTPRTLAEASSNFALDGVVRMECWRAAIKPLVQPENTVRKEILGRGQGTTAEMKRRAVAWCITHGIKITDDHAADAAVMWQWARQELLLRRGAISGLPLLRAAIAAGPAR